MASKCFDLSPSDGFFPGGQARDLWTSRRWSPHERQGALWASATNPGDFGSLGDHDISSVFGSDPDDIWIYVTCFVASQERRNGQFVGKWMVFTWGSNPPNFQSPWEHIMGLSDFFFNGISWRYQQIIDGSRELFWTSNWWKWTPLPLIFMQWHHQKLVSSLTFEAVWIYFLVTKQKRVLKAIHVVIYSLSLVILWHGIPKLQF